PTLAISAMLAMPCTTVQKMIGAIRTRIALMKASPSGSIPIKAVQALHQGETIWDDAVRGFGCRRQRRAPTYILKCRAGGRQRFVTIGPHGSPWTPDTARKEAKRLLGLVASGRDPAPAGRDTLGAVARDYLYAARPRLKPRS